VDNEQEEEPTPVDAPDKKEETILLRDLAPRQDVKGGSAKVRFGESTAVDSTGTT
jgi:hypothetical protein